MNTKKAKSEAMKFLEDLNGGTMTFGQMLEAIRVTEEMSQAELARKLKVTRAFICNVENGRKLVSPALAAKIAKVLKYPPTYFVAKAIQDQLSEAGLKFVIDLKVA